MTHLIGGQGLCENGAGGRGDLTNSEHGPNNLTAGLHVTESGILNLLSRAGAGSMPVATAGKRGAVPDYHQPTHGDSTCSILLATALTMAWSRKCWWNLSRLACQ